MKIGWIFAILIFAAALVFLGVLYSQGEKGGYEEEFLNVFGHPLFLSEEKSGQNLHFTYRLNKDRISAEYKLDNSAYQKVKAEEVGFNPFECRNNSLEIVLVKECQWRFLERDFDGIPDEVNGLRFDHLPKKVQKKLQARFNYALKKMTKGMVEKVQKHFCL